VEVDEDAIRAAPEDDEPRLAWARAEGGPRGELVEIQCALARGADAPALRAREAELLSSFGSEWAAELVFGLGAHRHRFVRGFVEHVEITAARLVRRAPNLAGTLISSLRITELEGRLGEVLSLPGLHALRALDLAENQLTNQDAVLVAEAPLAGLRTLELARNDIDDRGVESLAAARGPRRLERLGLAANVVELDGARALAASPLPLVELDVGQHAFAGHRTGNVIGPPALEALATRPWRRLVLSGNAMGNAGAEILARAWLGLEDLEIADANIGPSGAWALAASPHVAALRRLDLSQNPIGDDGASALEASPFLSTALELRVAGCALGDGILARLARRFARVVS
jgi:hypothetical protein